MCTHALILGSVEEYIWLGSLAGKLQIEMKTELSVGACNRGQWTTNLWDNQGHKDEEGRETSE